MNELEEMDQRNPHPMQKKYKHAKLLNALVDMQSSIAYAVRKSVLAEAEIAISSGDVEIDRLRALNADLLAALKEAEIALDYAAEHMGNMAINGHKVLRQIHKATQQAIAKAGA